MFKRATSGEGCSLCLDVDAVTLEVNPSVFTVPQDCARPVQAIKKKKWVMNLANIPAIHLPQRLRSEHGLGEKSESAQSPNHQSWQVEAADILYCWSPSAYELAFG